MAVETRAKKRRKGNALKKAVVNKYIDEQSFHEDQVDAATFDYNLAKQRVHNTKQQLANAELNGNPTQWWLEMLNQDRLARGVRRGQLIQTKRTADQSVIPGILDIAAGFGKVN